MPESKSQSSEPTPIKRRVKNALQETRFLLLGAQVLLAFQGRAALLPGFKDLSDGAKLFTLLGLFPALLLMMLLLAPLPYHRIVENGRVSERLHHFISQMARLGLLLFAFSLGCILFIAGDRVMGAGAALSVGLGATALGIGAWFGVETLAIRHKATCEPRHEEKEAHMEQGNDGEMPELSDRIDQVLSEGSMVVPGNTALLGFGLITMLLESFGDLPKPVQWVQFLGVLMIAFSTILLMTPAAYHRLVCEGEDSEDFYKLAGRLLTVALIPFALGINAGLFVVAYKVTNSYAVATVSTLVMLTLFYGFWFGYTAYIKGKREQRAKQKQPDTQAA